MKTQTKNINNEAVIYCRVSSKEQEDTGYSLPAQEKLLREYAQRKGLTILKVFSVAESASGTKQRKIFGEMMEYMQKKGIQILLCEKVDRLTRNLKEAVVANDWIEANEERQLHFVKQNLVIHRNAKSDEKFRWDIEIVLAKKYIANLSEEVRKGQAEKIAQGWLPAKPPLGYKMIGDKGHKTIAIDFEIAPLIQKMFELYATGNYSTPLLGKEMYKLGLRQHSGKAIPKSRIYSLLSYHFYYGKISWNGYLYDGKHQAIISKDLFDVVQNRLKRKQQNPHCTKHNQLLRSMAKCEHCGGLLSWELQKGNYYGHCSNVKAYRNCPAKTYMREDEAERQIMTFIEAIAPTSKEMLSWIEDVIRGEFKTQIEVRETGIKRFNGLLQKVRQGKDKYYEATIKKEVPIEFCQKKIAECEKEESILLEELRKVEDTCDDYQQLGLLIHELAYKAKEIYKKGTTEEKRLLFSQIITNFTQNRYELKPNWNLVGKYLSEWIPRLNKDYELQKSLITKDKTSFLEKTDQPVSVDGIEPSASVLSGQRSTTELHAQAIL